MASTGPIEYSSKQQLFKQGSLIYKQVYEYKSPNRTIFKQLLIRPYKQEDMVSK